MKSGLGKIRNFVLSTADRVRSMEDKASKLS